MIRLVLPLPPSANTYWRHSRNGIYISKQALEYREKVAVACAIAGVEPIEGPLKITAVCFICDDRRDLGNGEKQLSDALQGYAFADDNAHVEIHLYRMKAKTRKTAKVIVQIEEAPEMPDEIKALIDTMQYSSTI